MPTQWVQGIKRQGHKADHLHHLVLRFKNAHSITSTPSWCAQG